MCVFEKCAASNRQFAERLNNTLFANCLVRFMFSKWHAIKHPILIKAKFWAVCVNLQIYIHKLAGCANHMLIWKKKKKQRRTRLLWYYQYTLFWCSLRFWFCSLVYGKHAACWLAFFPCFEFISILYYECMHVCVRVWVFMWLM